MSKSSVTYPLGETPSAEETGGAPFKERFAATSVGVAPSGFGAVRTGEFRPPKKGEWYLSGAAPVGYRAPNDLHTAYYIVELVKVHRETRTVTTVTPLRKV